MVTLRRIDKPLTNFKQTEAAGLGNKARQQVQLALELNGYF